MMQGRRHLAFIVVTIPGDAPLLGFKDETLASGLKRAPQADPGSQRVGQCRRHASLPGVDAVFAANDATRSAHVRACEIAGLLQRSGFRTTGRRRRPG